MQKESAGSPKGEVQPLAATGTEATKIGLKEPVIRKECIFPLRSNPLTFQDRQTLEEYIRKYQPVSQVLKKQWDTM